MPPTPPPRQTPTHRETCPTTLTDEQALVEALKIPSTSWDGPRFHGLGAPRSTRTVHTDLGPVETSWRPGETPRTAADWLAYEAHQQHEANPEANPAATGGEAPRPVARRSRRDMVETLLATSVALLATAAAAWAWSAGPQDTDRFCAAAPSLNHETTYRVVESWSTAAVTTRDYQTFEEGTRAYLPTAGVDTTVAAAADSLNAAHHDVLATRGALLTADEATRLVSALTAADATLRQACASR